MTSQEGFQRQRDQYHLIEQILNRNDNVPNFALLLGAGASVSSNVKAAQELIDVWRRQLHSRVSTGQPYDVWLKDNYWYGNDDEYAILFEQMYDQPSLRRIFIEECLKDAHPWWGYVYLTSLLLRNYFNVVFTTNFDDLINEACYLYSDNLRPLVAAHDSAISNVRLVSARPKIIKLHGDFLYDNIKNTVRELESLEKNTQGKINQFAREYGLVVIGYSGRDRSVVDTLDTLLRSDDYFPNGVYWCIKKGERPSRRASQILARDRVFLVEIDGFDEFMADLHDSAKLSLPSPLSKPYAIARERTELFTSSQTEMVTHSIISRDINLVLREIDRVPPSQAPPPELRAVLHERLGNWEQALSYWHEAMEEEPSNAIYTFRYASRLFQLGKLDELRKFIEEKNELSLDNRLYFLLHLNENEQILHLTDIVKSHEPLEPVVRINRAIAFKRLGKEQELLTELGILEKDLSRDSDTADKRRTFALAAGIAALRKDKDSLLRNLKSALLGGQITIEQAKEFPVFEDFHENEEFKSIIKEYEQLDLQDAIVLNDNEPAISEDEDA